MKLDILAIGVHPDDVELGCSGTIINEIRLGKKVGIVDLTQGEFAKAVNVVQSSVSRIENGHVESSLKTMSAMLEPLGYQIVFAVRKRPAAKK